MLKLGFCYHGEVTNYMRDEDIHIGDVLRIRQWEDMVAEYGMTTRDEYSYYCATQVRKEVIFTKQMKHLCGLNFTVSNVYDLEVVDDNIKFYRSKENVEGEKDFGVWLICAEMLEPFIEEDFEVASDEDVKLLFG